MYFIIISVTIQLGLAIHVIKTNRKPIWVIIIGFVPILGPLAYIFVELLPGWLGHVPKEPTQERVRIENYPEKDLKAAIAQVELADTVSNRMKLAEQYLLRNRFQEAKQLYEKSLVGFYKTDPDLMLGLAKADFGLGNYDQTITTLEALKAANPDFKSAQGHLIYARAQELAGHTERAISEYETLIQYYPTPEPTCRLAMLLKANGDLQRSNTLFMKVITYSETADRHYNFTHYEWVTMAKKEMGI